MRTQQKGERRNTGRNSKEDGLYVLSVNKLTNIIWTFREVLNLLCRTLQHLQYCGGVSPNNMELLFSIYTHCLHSRVVRNPLGKCSEKHRCHQLHISHGSCRDLACNYLVVLQ